MKKGVEYTGEVLKLKFPNKGIVDCGDEGVAIVKGVLNGQRVRFVVFAVGRLHFQLYDFFVQLTAFGG